MLRVVALVADAAVGTISTLMVQHSKKIADKLREAAAFVAKKVHDAYPSAKPDADGLIDGPNPQAA
jgi:hypothetical protein